MQIRFSSTTASKQSISQNPGSQHLIETPNHLATSFVRVQSGTELANIPVEIPEEANTISSISRTNLLVSGSTTITLLTCNMRLILSPEVSDILSKMFSSTTKCELLILFHTHLGLEDSIDQIASQIGRSSEEIDRDVKDLVELGLLKSKRVNDATLISLDMERDEAIKNQICKALLSQGGIRALA